MSADFGETAEQSITGAKPSVKLIFRGKELKEGEDYTIVCRDNKAVTASNKKARITVRGKGCFSEKLEKDFSITKKSLSAASIRVEVQDLLFQPRKADSFVYKPKVIVYDGDGKLSGKEYKVSLSGNSQSEINKQLTEDGNGAENSAVLTATVEAAENGNYFGTVQVTAYVTHYLLANAVITVKDKSYTGRPVTLSADDITATIKTESGTRPLTPGSDFTIISYYDNKERGVAKATLRGTGKQYGGMKTVKFRITAKKIK